MAEDDPILICHRVVDLPIPYAAGEIRICTQGCLERVWVSHSSPRGPRPVCRQCAAVMLGDDPDHAMRLMDPTPRQIGELVRWLARGK